MYIKFTFNCIHDCSALSWQYELKMTCSLNNMKKIAFSLILQYEINKLTYT